MNAIEDRPLASLGGGDQANDETKNDLWLVYQQGALKIRRERTFLKVYRPLIRMYEKNTLLKKHKGRSFSPERKGDKQYKDIYHHANSWLFFIAFTIKRFT